MDMAGFDSPEDGFDGQVCHNTSLGEGHPSTSRAKVGAELALNDPGVYALLFCWLIRDLLLAY